LPTIKIKFLLRNYCFCLNNDSNPKIETLKNFKKFSR
jgi:hypothetical protein